MNNITPLLFENVRELAYTGLSSSYATVGSALAQSSRIIMFKNSTDVDVYITDDGTNNKLRLIAGTTDTFDERTNFMAAKVGTQYSAKVVSGSPTKGAIIIETAY